MRSVVFVHRYRESNDVADLLAKKAANECLCGPWFDTPPPFLVSVLMEDARGRAFPRFIE